MLFLYLCTFNTNEFLMTNVCDTGQLAFHKLTVDDRAAVQAVTLGAGRRNCNYTFANLIGWQFWYNTEVCICENAVVFRFAFEGRRAYMVCTAAAPSVRLVELLCADAAAVGSELMVLGVEDEPAAQVADMLPGRVTVYPRREQYDYIYLRQDLAGLKGGSLKAKRNHVNKFLSMYPDFVYRPLEPSLFDDCRRLAKLWRSEVEETRHDEDYEITVDAEARAMETVFNNWDQLDAMGGCIFIEGHMVAFTYGAPVTNDTFDVCVEKANRLVDGAFNIINQQFATHLPEQFVYMNREEDMGLEGLRKSKLSYHPAILLSYNNLIFRCQ